MGLDYQGKLRSGNEIDLLTVERDLEVLGRSLDGPANIRTRKKGDYLIAESESPGRSQEKTELTAEITRYEADLYLDGEKTRISPSATKLFEYLENTYTDVVEDPDIKNWRKTAAP